MTSYDSQMMASCAVGMRLVSRLSEPLPARSYDQVPLLH